MLGSFHVAFSLVPFLLGGLTLAVLLLQWKTYSPFAHRCFVLFVWIMTLQAVGGGAYLASLNSSALSGGLWIHLTLSAIAVSLLHFYRHFEKREGHARFFFALLATVASLVLVGASLASISH